MIHGLTTASSALLDRLSRTIQQHPKRITAAVAAILLTGGGGAFAVASFAPDPAELPVRMVTYPVESLAENLVLGELEAPGFSLFRSEQVRSSDTPESLLQRLGVADPAAAASVLMRALGLVGTPYRYGGNTPESGFDCSGLVTYVYRDMLALNLPRTSRELAAIQGPKIATDRLTAGDLVFFGDKGNVWHVGIYVGEGRFVHAPSTGGTVRLDYLDGPYWRNHYTGAKRVLR